MAGTNNNQNRTSTSTQIRNMYSDGISCLNIKFFNMNLSFQWYPFSGKDQNGRDQYDSKHGQSTTVNVEGAFALYQVSKDIIDEKIRETNISIPCLGASVNLERKIDMNGQMETIFSITKNGVTIPFKFQTIQQQYRDENGQVQTKYIESGLGSFMKTIEGYLTGINAERHLNKLTDDYAKLMDDNKQQSGGGYRPNNNFKRPYNNGGYNRSNQQNWGGQNQDNQRLENYQLPQN